MQLTELSDLTDELLFQKFTIFTPSPLSSRDTTFYLYFPQ